MPATLIQQERIELHAEALVSIALHQLPAPMPGSPHAYKYRLALIVSGVCVLRYDNEAGKGDHKHVGEREHPYTFIDLDRLIDDFWADVSLTL